MTHLEAANEHMRIIRANPAVSLASQGLIFALAEMRLMHTADAREDLHAAAMLLSGEPAGSLEFETALSGLQAEIRTLPSVNEVFDERFARRTFVSDMTVALAA
jgi:hypothetical protein